MEENLGIFASKFVSKRVDTPHPEEIEAWSQLVYAALFAVGFVVWLHTARKCSSEDEMTNQLNNLINEIAKDADVWINRKAREALKISDLNITVDSTPVIKLHRNAMFTEAITVMTEGKFAPEAARSHACFVHLQANLQRLVLVAKVPIGVRNVLKQSIAGCDAMAAEIQTAL